MLLLSLSVATHEQLPTSDTWQAHQALWIMA